MAHDKEYHLMQEQLDRDTERFVDTLQNLACNIDWAIVQRTIRDTLSNQDDLPHCRVILDAGKVQINLSLDDPADQITPENAGSTKEPADTNDYHALVTAFFNGQKNKVRAAVGGDARRLARLLMACVPCEVANWEVTNRDIHAIMKHFADVQ